MAIIGFPRLEPAKFNALLRKLGQDTSWRQASLCPCRNPYSYAANPDCNYCYGHGVIWASGVVSYVGLTGMARQQQWAQMGMYEAGDVVVTLPENSPVYQAAALDRITFVNTEERFDTVLTRGGANDRLAFTVVRLDRVTWMNDDQEIVTGSRPSVHPMTGVLTWTGLAPVVGHQYVISGWRRPEYYVWGDLGQSRFHHAGYRLPRRVVLRRFDLFGR